MRRVILALLALWWVQAEPAGRIPVEAITSRDAFVIAANGQSYFSNPSAGLYQVPFLPGVYRAFGFSPDARYFLYLKTLGGFPAFTLYRRDLRDGSEEAVSSAGERVLQAAWAPDSNRIVYLTVETATSHRLWVTGSGPPVAIVEGWLNPEALEWTPDGASVRYETVRALSENAFSENAFEFEAHEVALAGGRVRSVERRVDRTLLRTGDGAVFREFTGSGAKFHYVDRATNAARELLAITSTYKLPLAGQMTLVQGGSAYTTNSCDGANCDLTTHIGQQGFALDFVQVAGQGDDSVLAVADGTVAAIANNVTCNSVRPGCSDFRSGCVSNGGAGNYVIVAHLDGSFSVYAHLAPNSIKVGVGQAVCQGTVLGKQGHTGAASTSLSPCGDHLHFDRKTTLALVSNPLGQPGMPTNFAETPCGLACRTVYTSQNAIAASCRPPIILDSTPAGAEVLVDGVAYQTPYAFHWAENENHVVSAPALYSPGGIRYGFADWSDGGAQTHTLRGVPSATTHTVRYLRQYPLATTVVPFDGGSITVSPASTDGFYNSGTRLQLVAVPKAGYEFLVWGGDLLNVATATATLPVTVRALAVTANFRQVLGIAPGGVVNGADFSTAFTPGMIFSVFGRNLGVRGVPAGGAPLPTTLDGVGVRVYDGASVFDAPLYYVSPGQINAQLPFEITGSSVQIEVRNRLGSTRTGSIDIAPASPRLFTKTSSGLGEAFVVRGDYTLVTADSPVAPGEAVFTYVNGMGRVAPLKTSGFPAGDGGTLGPLNQVVEPVTVTVGGQEARVFFAGLAPSLVGVYQVNFEIPAGLAAGNQTVAVAVGGERSQDGVFVPYRP